MGEVIRKDASVDDIAGDANTTLKNAAARGGAWKTLAEERLGPCVTLLNKITADASSAEETVSIIDAEIDALDQKADKFLGNKSDEMWNLLGRPGFDPWFTLLWPGGYAAYADGADDEQPDRMDLLAELLEAGLHPVLDPAWAKATAQAVRAEASAYRAKVEAARGPRAKVKLLGKMRTTLARAAQMELARLKRRYQAEGFTEAEIHQVIPDRPSSKPAKKSAPAAPAQPSAGPGEPAVTPK